MNRIHYASTLTVASSWYAIRKVQHFFTLYIINKLWYWDVINESNLMRMACFWNKLHQVRKTMERLQSQIIVKVLGAIKQKDLKSAKVTKNLCIIRTYNELVYN
jgi:hypothetical protein